MVAVQGPDYNGPPLMHSFILGKCNIKTVHILVKKIFHMLRSAINTSKSGLKASGFYSILCKCEKRYIEQKYRSIETVVKEHAWHLCLYQPDNSAVTEHIIELGHCIKRPLQGTWDTSQNIRLHGPTCQRETELKLYLKTVNREEGVKLIKTRNCTRCTRSVI
jgi:hypothetical protein